MNLPASCADHAACLAKLTEQIQADRYEREKFRDGLQGALDEIKAKQDKTNGRVTRLEHWRTFLLGGFAALSLPAAAKLVQLLHP